MNRSREHSHEEDPLDAAIDRSLKKAFDPVPRMASLEARVAAGIADSGANNTAERAAEHADDQTAVRTSDPVDAPPMRIAPRRTSPLRWLSLVAASIVIALATLFAVRSLNGGQEPRTYASISPTQVYRREVAGGLVPSWTCTADQFPREVGKRFDGSPIALATMPAELQLIGWTQPYYRLGQTLSHDELILMARFRDEPLIVILSKSPPTRSMLDDAGDGLHLHAAQTGPFHAIEVSAFAEPRLIPLLDGDEKD
jgi:hypothetical protein